jgi:hypothetical protein
MLAHYFKERVRQRIRYVVAPPQPTLLPSAPDRKRSSVPSAPPAAVAAAEPAPRRLPIVSA